MTANSPASPGDPIIVRRIRRVLGRVLVYALIFLLCSFILLPVAWMLTAALKPDLTPILTMEPEWFPTKYFDWNNFVRILTLESQPFLRFAINTVVLAGFNIVATVASCSLVAFAFARMRFRFSGPLFYLLIITMLIPWQALIIPQFLAFHAIGWYGTYLPLIVPAFGANAFFVFLIRQYMRTIPRELDDAARIDGASWFQIFRHVVLPLSKPVLAVVVVFTFIGRWNDLLGPLLYLNTTNDFTVPIGLANLAGRAGNAQYNLLMAANFLSILPPAVIYFIIQKQLIGGIASVGLKG
jgi:multiple sugar transport system permease protein